MIGSARLIGALQHVVKRGRADAISVCVQAASRRVTRFAYQTIHQNVAQDTITVYVKVLLDGRVGVAVAGTLEPESLKRTLRAAMAIARHAPPLANPPELPRRMTRHATADYHAPTANTPPTEVVSILKRAFRICQGVEAQLAGSLAVGADEMAVVNSQGVSCYAASTVSSAKLVTMYRKLSGYASSVHHRLDRLPFEQTLERALAQCLHRHEPLALPTGTYEVILEPEAVAELVVWLGYIAFGAKSVQEKTSCLAGRMGEPLMAPSITIVDDGLHPKGLRMPFDFEGTPKQRVTLIDRGKAAGIVYDTTYGALYGQPSTGHGGPPTDTDGPLPLHLVMEGGSRRRQELIRSCERGLWIPRFHYVNGLLNPREALMTGLTREGTFLIEKGKLSRPVATLRFTQSCLEAFGRVLGISSERRLIADPVQEAGCAVVPALHLARFRFTGRSEE